MLTFEPRQLAGHRVHLIAQRAHQRHSLGGIVIVHGGIVASAASPRERNGPADNPITETQGPIHPAD
jgi:hypothetical protein